MLKSDNIYIQDIVFESSSSGSTGNDPQEVLQEILKEISPGKISWEEYFLPVTSERTQAYSLALTKAVRYQNFEALQAHVDRGLSVNACNAHGESLMHLVARRAEGTKMLQFFLDHGSSLKVKDDYGKTPLTEACWSRQPNFSLIKMILRDSPELLFAKDSRGFTPMHYIPRECHEAWAVFLRNNAASIRLSVQCVSFARSRDQLQQNHQRLQDLIQHYTATTNNTSS